LLEGHELAIASLFKVLSDFLELSFLESQRRLLEAGPLNPYLASRAHFVVDCVYVVQLVSIHVFNFAEAMHHYTLNRTFY
jgi:peroxiredoxin